MLTDGGKPRAGAVAVFAATLLLTVGVVALDATAAEAQQLDCPDGAIVVLDGEQVCFPSVSGPIPAHGQPLAFGVPRGNTGGVEAWCVRHNQQDASPPTNPWRVPCQVGTGERAWWFSIAWDCYVAARDDLAERDPSWPRRGVGEDDSGRPFEIRCYPPGADQQGTLYMDGFGLWQTSQMIIGPESPPGFGGTPSVVPALWVEAVNALAMRGPEIATAPPLDGAALVNLPVWLWTETGGRVWPADPLHEVAAAAGQRVDAYAEPTRIEWNLGDGTSPVVCQGPGTAWRRGLDLLEPDDCHHVYRRASRREPGGTFEITAVTTWRVWWEINGAFDGETALEVGSTSPYQVDEIQVVTGRR
ncbi:MAG: hypothetical protein ACRDT2_14960 [Natronosporangium sp.]